ncbi:MAG: sigma-70 family RNA polymerase sigma factor [Propionibacteriaceae bacterium]|nr:sigma-70 family RNA polymerase sigma factor [Propionibacteriaceae bacterium]
MADQELVSRARDGDPAAMDELITILRPAIFTYCRFRLSSYGGGSDAADDAAQETCLAVSRVLAGYQDEGVPFKAWVYAIAANKIADAQRRFSRAAVVLSEIPEQVEPSPTPEERTMASIEFSAALELMKRLPAKMREVLLLRASGATAKSVAQVLGMSPGAVNVAHHRAVARMRQLASESTEHRELFAGLTGRAAKPDVDRAA